MVRKLSMLSAVLVTVIIAGCASEANYASAVRSWQGASQRQLFHVWGYPNRIKKIGNGHRLLIYKTVNRGRYPQVTTPGYVDVSTSGGTTTVSSMSPTTSGGGSYDFRCTTWFEVNSHHRIVNTSFRGNNCQGTDSFVKRYRR